MPSATVTVLVPRVEVGKVVQKQSKAVSRGQVRAGRRTGSWKERGMVGSWMPKVPIISTHLQQAGEGGRPRERSGEEGVSVGEWFRGSC